MFSILIARFAKNFLYGKDPQYFWNKLLSIGFLSAHSSPIKFSGRLKIVLSSVLNFLSQICGLWQSTKQLQFLLMTILSYCNWQVSYVRLLLQFIPGCCFNNGKKLIVKCSAVQLSMLVIYHLNPCDLYSVHVNQIHTSVFSLYTTQGGASTLLTTLYNMKDIFIWLSLLHRAFLWFIYY
jgi:hypothetical protein